MSDHVATTRPKRMPGSTGAISKLDRMLHWTLLLCCGMALSKGLADSDFWGHVQYGRDVLTHGLPAESTYTYTAVGHRWINHENIAELAFAIGVDTIGQTGLLVLKMLAGMLTLALILRKSRRDGVGQLAACTGVILVASNMMLFWTLRPQLFSFIYFVLLLALLDYAFEDWSPRTANFKRIALRLAPTILLMAVWANTHGGFLAGFCVMTACLGLRGLECVIASCRGDSGLATATSRTRWRPVRIAFLTFGGITVAAGLATLANPYGWELHQWLLASLGIPRPEIIEWRPPEWSAPWVPFWLLVAAVVASAWRSKHPRDWVHLTVVGLTLWQSVEHRRHVVFLSLLFGFWMLPHWDSLLKRCGIGRDESTIGESLKGAGRTALGLGLGAVLLLLSVSLAFQVRRIPIRHDNYPVDAFQFIADQGLSGRLLVQLRWGQYAIAAFGNSPSFRSSGSDASGEEPVMRVAFDGRFRTCYPQLMVDRYFDFAEGPQSKFRHPDVPSPPANDTAILDQSPRPDFVLIDRKTPHSLRVMNQQNENWVLLYQDPLCRFYGRRDQCDAPTSKNYVPLASRQVHNLPLRQISDWPALPRAANRPHRQDQQLAARPQLGTQP